MSSKKLTITLESGWAVPYMERTETNRDNETLWARWKVIKVTNSVEYRPGKLLEKKEVESLCEANNWEVTIVGKKS